MELRKMVMITLYAKQKKRHRCTEQTFGLCGRRRGWDVSENSIETCILSRVKQITSPGWMHETSARAWCTGKTQRDRVEREVGGGIGMGNTCKSMIHVNVWQKPLQYCKVISLQLIKINGKKLKIIIKKKTSPLTDSTSPKEEEIWFITVGFPWHLERRAEAGTEKVKEESLRSAWKLYAFHTRALNVKASPPGGDWWRCPQKI